MFTGIIEALGTVAETCPQDGDLRLKISAPDWDWSDVALGDSIATNGVCLTVVQLDKDGFWADASLETLNLTTVKHWKPGSPVNLEKALTPKSRLGGHLVSGHVDGIGDVISRHADARSERFTVEAPAALARYIAHKGSITVDGTSLTVNRVEGTRFELNIVPHTLQWTIMNHYKAGTQVNLEVDVIARYLERLLMAGDINPDTSRISEAFLQENGYWKS